MSDINVVTDFPLQHPRKPYFDAFAAAVRDGSGGGAAVKLTSDPIYARLGGIEAVKQGKAQMTWVTVSYLEALIPPFGVATLPFTMTDAALSRPGAAARAVEFLSPLLEPSGLTLLAIMRGADQIIMLTKALASPQPSLNGARIRVTGPGHFEDIVRAIDGVPVPLPVHLTKAAMANGEIDGVMSSPGVWQTVVGSAAPYAIHVPNFSLLTYMLVADAAWLSGLAPGMRDVLAGAADRTINTQWMSLFDDDRAVLAELGRQGHRLETVTDIAPWRDKVAGVSARFRKAHPGLVEALSKAIDVPA